MQSEPIGMKSRMDELEIPTQRKIKEYVENVAMSPRPSRIDNFIVKVKE